jgi:hypothetical protein
MGGVMVQVNPAQFPHKLVRVEIAPEFSGCNHFVNELRKLTAPPFLDLGMALVSPSRIPEN